MNPYVHRIRLLVLFAGLLILALTTSVSFAFTPSGLLEIHHINVLQGDCTLIIGPDGTIFLIDAGNTGKGNNCSNSRDTRSDTAENQINSCNLLRPGV